MDPETEDGHLHAIVEEVRRVCAALRPTPLRELVCSLSDLLKLGVLADD